jgi:hypothetical protein
VLRNYLLFAPEKALYGTDAASYPSVPGGADVQHLVLSRATRDALYLVPPPRLRDYPLRTGQASTRSSRQSQARKAQRDDCAEWVKRRQNLTVTMAPRPPRPNIGETVALLRPTDFA